jgi:hypothetical protein
MPSINTATTDTSFEPLIESNFFEYVADSDVLLYFVGADHLLEGLEMIRSSVEDAISAAQLLRATRGRPSRSSLRVRVALVVSKVDLLTLDEVRYLGALLDREHEFSSSAVQGLYEVSDDFALSVRHLERLIAVVGRIADDFECFAVSSLDAAVGTGVLDKSRVAELRSGHRSNAKVQQDRPSSTRNVLYPLRWVVGQLWSGRHLSR